MNTPTPPNRREPLDRDERELAELYRQLPEARPGPELDARVLAEAERAVARPSQRRPQRWLLGFGSAAALVLAAGLVWQQQRNERPHAGPGTSEEQVSAPAAKAAPMAAERDKRIPIRLYRKPDAANAASPAVPPGAPEPTHRAVSAGGQPSMTQLQAIPQKPSIGGMRLPNASSPSASDALGAPENRPTPLTAPPPPPPPAMPEPAAPDARMGFGAMTSAPAAQATAPSAKTPALSELLQRARSALKRHDRKQARRLALRIREIYPDARLPDDLAALLPAHAASTGTP